MSDIPHEIYLAKSTAFTTNVVFIKGFTGFSSQILTTNGSTFAATAFIQMSNDNINWVTLTSDSLPLAGTTDVALFDVPITAVSFYRLSITFTTGSADFNITYNVKD